MGRAMGWEGLWDRNCYGMVRAMDGNAYWMGRAIVWEGLWDGREVFFVGGRVDPYFVHILAQVCCPSLTLSLTLSVFPHMNKLFLTDVALLVRESDEELAASQGTESAHAIMLQTCRF